MAVTRVLLVDDEFIGGGEPTRCSLWKGEAGHYRVAREEEAARVTVKLARAMRIAGDSRSATAGATTKPGGDVPARALVSPTGLDGR
jgi:hypothetical protein